MTTRRDHLPETSDRPDATAAPVHAITLNGRSVTTAAPTVAALLVEQGYAGAKVATALNGDFLPERLRPATTLHAGDRVEVVSARQGG